MIHLSQFKTNLLQLTRLMIKTGMYVDVIYKGRLYRVSIEDLHQDVVKRRRPRKRSLTDQIDAKKCPQCKKLMLNGVCMNSLCATNLKTSDIARRSPVPQA